MLKMTAMVVVLTGLALGSLGCEERVVGTRNDWVGSQYHPEQSGLEQDDDEKGLGEMLFGWTGLTGKKDSNTSQMRVVEPADRSTGSQSSGGSGNSYY